MARILRVRRDIHAEDLRRLAMCEGSSRFRRRIAAVAALLDGCGRAEAAAAGGMQWQTLRDWVARYNDEGLAGLRDRRRHDASQKLAPGQVARLVALVEAGPQPGGCLRRGWRRAELVELCRARFGVAYSERGISLLMERLGLAHLTIRPRAARRAGQVQGPDRLPDGAPMAAE